MTLIEQPQATSQLNPQTKELQSQEPQHSNFAEIPNKAESDFFLPSVVLLRRQTSTILADLGKLTPTNQSMLVRNKLSLILTALNSCPDYIVQQEKIAKLKSTLEQALVTRQSWDSETIEGLKISVRSTQAYLTMTSPESFSALQRPVIVESKNTEVAQLQNSAEVVITEDDTNLKISHFNSKMNRLVTEVSKVDRRKNELDRPDRFVNADIEADFARAARLYNELYVLSNELKSSDISNAYRNGAIPSFKTDDAGKLINPFEVELNDYRKTKQRPEKLKSAVINSQSLKSDTTDKSKSWFASVRERFSPKKQLPKIKNSDYSSHSRKNKKGGIFGGLVRGALQLSAVAGLSIGGLNAFSFQAQKYSPERTMFKVNEGYEIVDTTPKDTRKVQQYVYEVAQATAARFDQLTKDKFNVGGLLAVLPANAQTNSKIEKLKENPDQIKVTLIKDNQFEVILPNKLAQQYTQYKSHSSVDFIKQAKPGDEKAISKYQVLYQLFQQINPLDNQITTACMDLLKQSQQGQQFWQSAKANLKTTGLDSVIYNNEQISPAQELNAIQYSGKVVSAITQANGTTKVVLQLHPDLLGLMNYTR